MRILLVLCCLSSMTIAAQEQRIRLEDIERDNLNNERKVKEMRQGPKTPPKLQFGFKPMKMHHQEQKTYAPSTQYTNQDVEQQYTQVQYVPQYQPAQYVPSYSSANQQYYQNDQETPKEYQYYYVQPSSSTNNIESVVDPKTGQVQYFMYVPVQYYQDTSENVASQNYVEPEPKYQYASLPQEQVAPKYTQVVPKQSTVKYEQPDNIPQYYPTQTAHQTQNYQSVPTYQTQEYQTQEYQVPSYQNQAYQSQAYQGQAYQGQAHQAQALQSQVYQSQGHQAPVYQAPVQQYQAYQNQAYQTQAYQVPQKAQSLFRPFVHERIIAKSHNSLLDSYVPSILQIQYYKEQEARLNALRSGTKFGQNIIGKTDFVKNTRQYLPAPTPLSYTHTKRGTSHSKPKKT